MSSSNLVRVAFIEETVYGETPGAGNFKTARFTSESLSGTPETTESQQIRTDRLSSGQVVTGLTVQGDLNFELAKEDAVDEFIESAMFSTFVTDTPVAVELAIDVTAGTITRSAGDYNVDVEVGDVLTLSGFTNSVNNIQVMVASIDSATVISYIGPDTLVDETEAGASFVVADRIEIGITKKSFSIEKSFLDLTNKAINYKGQIVSNMNLSVEYGSIVTGSFSFNGNSYDPVDQASDFLTNLRTIDPAATSNSMNGSIDMPFIATQDGSVFTDATFCIQSLEISLNNNLTPQTCIGEAAPKDYTPGTAQIEISMSAYLADENWSYLQKKLTQDPVSFGFVIKNNDGFYGFYLPAVQLSFDDPSSAGQNQDVIMAMSGVAKVGANNEKSLRIYKG